MLLRRSPGKEEIDCRLSDVAKSRPGGMSMCPVCHLVKQNVAENRLFLIESERWLSMHLTFTSAAATLTILSWRYENVPRLPSRQVQCAEIQIFFHCE